jgi:hypothetical protein
MEDVVAYIDNAIMVLRQGWPIVLHRRFSPTLAKLSRAPPAKPTPLR